MWWQIEEVEESIASHEAKLSVQEAKMAKANKAADKVVTTRHPRPLASKRSRPWCGQAPVAVPSACPGAVTKVANKLQQAREDDRED